MEGTKEAAVQSSFLKRQPNKTEYDLVLECLRYIKGIYLALSTPKAMAIQALIAPRHKVKLIKINLDRGLFKYEYKNGTGKANKVLGDLAMKSAKTVETDYFAAMSLKGGAISAVRKEGALIPDAYNPL